MKLAIVSSHPIQHFCPAYESWHKSGIDLHVFFATRSGLDEYYDPQFGRRVKWGGLTMNFPHSFLQGTETSKVDNELDNERLNDALKARAPDAVMVYGYSQRLQVRAREVTMAMGASVLLTSDSNARQKRSALKLAVKRHKLQRIASTVDIFLTVGDSNEEYWKAYGAPHSKLVRCPFAIDVNLYDKCEANRDELRRQLRQRLDLRNDDFVVLMVGKLVPWKNQIELIRAIADTQRSCPRVKLVLAGTGPDEDLLRSASKLCLQNSVKFAGFIDPVDLPAFYYASDLYAHSSSKEAHALAITEATYCGLPVVCSDRCGSYGPNDDLAPGRNGLVYRSGSDASLARAITFLANEDKMRERMARESLLMSKNSQRLAHGEAIHAALNLVSMRSL